MAKGYTVGEDGIPYSQTERAGEVTGVHCQLLNAIGDDEIDALLRDPHWWLQEKQDGERRLIRKIGTEIIGINRRGLQVALPEVWTDDCLGCASDFLIDGEAVGNHLYVFDILSSGDQECREKPYLERYLTLMQLLTAWGSSFIRIVKTACTDGEKKRCLQSLRDNNAEGAVFKRIDAPYTSGRPASGGSALKFKFVESASFIVSRINAKRSVSLALLDDGVVRGAGNVTIPANHTIPEVGQVVEVRYLYAFKESGHIYQPVYLGVRADIDHDECTVSQLKYKASAAREIGVAQGVANLAQAQPLRISGQLSS